MEALFVKQAAQLLTMRHLRCLSYIVVCGGLFLILFFSLSFDSRAIRKVDQHANVTYSHEIIVKKGDTLLKLIYQQNLSKDEKSRLAKFLFTNTISHKLQIGQKVTFFYQTYNTHKQVLKNITFAMKNHSRLEIVEENGDYKIIETQIPYKRSLSKLLVPIEGNFVNSLHLLGIPLNTAIELAESYSNKINFNRDIKEGDKLRIIIEKFYNEDSGNIHYGKVLYSGLENAGKIIELFLYQESDCLKSQYYFAEGLTASNNFSIPIKEGGRVTSKFGYRNHPILKRRIMHNGVDIAAKKGTTVYAVSSGKIRYAGWGRGYGNYIRIAHNANLRTEYAHLCAIAQGIKQGSHIYKGQVIGYVGKTGTATAPHLHFGVISNNKYVDPLKFKIANHTILAGDELVKFDQHKKNIMILFKKLDKHLEVALDKTQAQMLY